MDISKAGGGVDYDSLLEAIDSHGWKVRRNGQSNARTQCPAHEGGDTNLNIDRTSEDKALVYCHSHQCEYSDILEAVGIEFQKSAGSAGYGRTPIREHKYYDDDGLAVAVKTKYLVADGDNGFRYEWTLDYPHGKLARDERPLYARPSWDLARDTLYIVEGEKDADAAIKYWGVNATSPMFGAGSWEDHWTPIVSELFSSFAIIADNDQAGIDGAEKIASALNGLPVVVYSPPEHIKDVADMVKEDFGLEDLVQLSVVEAAAPTPQTQMAHFEEWDEFATREHEKAEWLIEPIALAGRATNLHAEAGQGKSELVLNLVAKSGVETMWLDREMTTGDAHERLFTDMQFAPGDLGHLHYAFFPDYPPFDEPEGGEALLLDALAKDVRLVVIDSLSKFVAGDENENGTNQRLYTYTVNRLRKEGIAFLMIDHTGKNRQLGARGASAKKDNVDLFLSMRRNAVGQRITVTKKRNSMVKDGYDVSRTLNPLNYGVIDGQVITPAVRILANKLDALNIGEDLSRDNVATLLRRKGEKVSNDNIIAAQKFRKGERTDVEQAEENLGDLVAQD